MNVIASPEQMRRADADLRRLARLGPASELTLIREGLVKLPFPGFETIHRSHPVAGDPSYFWGLLLDTGSLALDVRIIGDGEFGESVEFFWRKVIQSIRVTPDAVARPVPRAIPSLTPAEIRGRNERGIRQVLRRVRAVRDTQKKIESPSFECTAAGVLHQLDFRAQTFSFPLLDNGHLFQADSRLSAYGDGKCWAVIIEILGYNPRATGYEGFADALYCFGNCLKGQPPGLSDVGSVYTASDGPKVPLFSQGNDLNTDAESLCIRDIVVPINRDPVFLASKRIGPRFDAAHLKAYAMRQKEPLRKNLLDAARRMEDAGGADEFRGQDLLRSLVPEHRNLLLATDDELSQRLSMELPLLLRLDAWHHPDISAGELPSESEAFKMIAEVLATGDASWYKPTQEPNTHWSNWPMGGDL